jgi:hypothetical protein
MGTENTPTNVSFDLPVEPQEFRPALDSRGRRCNTSEPLVSTLERRAWERMLIRRRSKATAAT